MFGKGTERLALSDVGLRKAGAEFETMTKAYASE